MSKISDTWKVQLTMTINFISSKDTDCKGVLHSKSDNIEIMVYDKVDKVIEKHFDSLFLNIKLGWKIQCKVVILSSIPLICCVTNVMKQI